MKRIKTYPSLKAWRAAQAMNQREAARELGVSQALYARTESRRGAPRPKRALAISEKTGVPFEIVMGVA
jgi:transcriptional regulator with XRE-family HTH domain